MPSLPVDGGILWKSPHEQAMKDCVVKALWRGRETEVSHSFLFRLNFLDWVILKHSPEHVQSIPPRHCHGSWWFISVWIGFYRMSKRGLRVPCRPVRKQCSRASSNTSCSNILNADKAYSLSLLKFCLVFHQKKSSQTCYGSFNSSYWWSSKQMRTACWKGEGFRVGLIQISIISGAAYNILPRSSALPEASSFLDNTIIDYLK